MARLACCNPTGYDGSSQTPVHSLRCSISPEATLTPTEFAEWRGHPVVYKGSHLRVVTPPVTTTSRPRRTRERWDVGFRDPAWEDFS